MESRTPDIETNSVATSPEGMKEDALGWSVDPANAQNWTLPKKIYNTSIPSLLCLLISFGLAIYSPSHTKAQDAFHTTITMSLLPFTLYVYGLAFGPVISAPLSETFGRRFIYIIMTPLALLFILGAGFAKNLATLAICRLLAGILGSAPLAVGAGTIMDIWTGHYPNRGVVVLMMIAFLGPALGSLVGGFIAEYKDWRWSQWTTLFFGAALWVYVLGAQETYASPIRRRQAQKMGLPPPPKPIPSGMAGVKVLLTVTLARPLYMLLTEPIVLLCSLYASLNFSVLFCFLASVPLIYNNNYGFSPGQCGLAFIGIAVGCLIGALVLILLDRHTLAKHHARNQNVTAPPERLLVGAMVGSPLMPAALFWFAWTSLPGIHWISSIIAMALFGCSNILIFVSTALYLTNVYGAKYGASALAANGLLRYCVGGSFPLFTIAMYNNLGFTWASSLLGFLSVGFSPLPWIFYRFGRKIRQSSAYTS
ncbi:major facilitator superfamily domain-containing protein [Aspergillus alliaceus]|uniref:Major facilitator superfamily domain-containing protein n=1 Tax=Petromyces alliaceus TaxID=209559 RepID=A0A5N7BW73_PETAA|nr:major facilitator superfamily domain-containing protein [Aspergillus alliaceus]